MNQIFNNSTRTNNEKDESILIRIFGLYMVRVAVAVKHYKNKILPEVERNISVIIINDEKSYIHDNHFLIGSILIRFQSRFQYYYYMYGQTDELTYTFFI